MMNKLMQWIGSHCGTIGSLLIKGALVFCLICISVFVLYRLGSLIHWVATTFYLG